MHWISEVLAHSVEIVSICPEVGAGMLVPRPPIQVIRRPGEEMRIVVVDEGSDKTSLLQQFVRKHIAILESQPIDGYIFKARSPSCGLRDTPHYASATNTSTPVAYGSGLWAAAIAAELPQLPCVDESEVVEPEGQERFLALVRVHRKARS